MDLYRIEHRLDPPEPAGLRVGVRGPMYVAQYRRQQQASGWLNARGELGAAPADPQPAGSPLHLAATLAWELAAASAQHRAYHGLHQTRLAGLVWGHADVAADASRISRIEGGYRERAVERLCERHPTLRWVHSTTHTSIAGTPDAWRRVADYLGLALLVAPAPRKARRKAVAT